MWVAKIMDHPGTLMCTYSYWDSPFWETGLCFIIQVWWHWQMKMCRPAIGNKCWL